VELSQETSGLWGSANSSFEVAAEFMQEHQCPSDGLIARTCPPAADARPNDVGPPKAAISQMTTKPRAENKATTCKFGRMTLTAMAVHMQSLALRTASSISDGGFYEIHGCR
jgi:hypothetical protein